jgi:hypothetical protein
MIKPGDIVFFKKVTRSTKRRDPEIAFKGGNGFGVMLGIVPPFGPEPTESILLMLLGSVGFVSFDDVKDFLGEDQMKICVDKFTERYMTKKIEQPSKLILPSPSGVLEAE